MWAVSQGVADNIRTAGEFRGDLLVLRNGCDYGFWEESGAATHAPPDAAPVALFQGNLNTRVDYGLLITLARRMPDWAFHFCGSIAAAPDGWQTLCAEPNVRYLGMLEPGAIAEASRHAAVGLIPFVQADYIWRSLPLKAYEYLACGLPVVSVPIEELERQPDLFAIARSPEDFEGSIRRLASTRAEPDLIASRMRAARAVSYDRYFEMLTDRLQNVMANMTKRRPRLNVLMFYDERSVHVKTIREHLDAFSLYSHCRVHFMSGTGPWGPEVEPVDLRAYDAIVVHYSIRLSLSQHLAQDIAASISRFDGPKLLFIQDEYDTTETARRWIERLGIDCVFTNVPLDSLQHVYPTARFAHVDFVPTLTGYVPEDERIEEFVMPLQERATLIGYRGRKLPHQYGALGWDKFRIGVEMKRIAAERGLPADIEVDDTRRIYGDDWYRFLGSCRATLGTESGCNLFDDTGAYAKLAALHAELDYPEFAARYLPDGEGPVRMNQISPKIFEAIRLRTVLVLFEGEYSGIVQPGLHYVALKRDFSNVEDVLAKLQDDAFVRQLTQRAYNDIIVSGRHSLRTFVEGVDAYLHQRARGRKRATFVTAPLVAVAGGQTAAAQRKGSLRPILDQVVPPDVLTQEQIYDQIRIAGAELFPPLIPLMAQVESALSGSTAAIAQSQSAVGQAQLALVSAQAAIAETQTARQAIEGMAQDVTGILVSMQQTGAAVQKIIEHRRQPFWYRGAQALWYAVPASLRFRLLERMRSLRGR